MQTLALSAIAQRADDPHEEIDEFFCDRLPAGSPFHLLPGGKADSVKRLRPEGLASDHAKYFVPQNMVVAVFGDVEPDAALAIVEKHFGNLEPVPKFEKIDFRRDNAIAKTAVFHKTTPSPPA